MGARESGPHPCMNVVKLAATIALVFHFTDQFSGSWGSSEGWGTRTCCALPALLTKWCCPTSVMTSVPGRISTWSSSSIWWSSCRSHLVIALYYLWKAYLFMVFRRHGGRLGTVPVWSVEKKTGRLNLLQKSQGLYLSKSIRHIKIILRTIGEVQRERGLNERNSGTLGLLVSIPCQQPDRQFKIGYLSDGRPS